MPRAKSANKTRDIQEHLNKAQEALDESEEKNSDDIELKEDTLASNYEEKIAQFYAIAGTQDFTVRAEQFDEKTNRWWMLTREPLTPDFNFSPRMQMYGTGKYRFTLYDEKGRYASTDALPGSFTIYFKALPVPPSGAASSDKSQEVFVTMLKEQNAQFMQLFTILAGRQAPAQAQPSLLDQLTMFEKLKSLTHQPQPNSLELLTAVLKVTDHLKEGSAPESGVLRDLEIATTILEKMGVSFNLGKGAQAALPQKTTATEPPVILNTPKTAAPETPMDYKQYLAPHVKAFLKLAETGQEIEDVAEHLITQLDLYIVPYLTEDNQKRYPAAEVTDDMVWDRLLAFAENPEIVPQILKVYPEFAPHEAWVRGVLAKAVFIYKEEPEESPLSATPAERVQPPEPAAVPQGASAPHDAKEKAAPLANGKKKDKPA